jgi:hypothetical protein
MRQVECLIILLLSIMFVASYVYAGGGYGGHGASRSGPSSGHGGGYDGGKHSGYSDPSGGNKGYGGKQSGGAYPSSGSKGYGEKTYSAKGSKDSKEENLISPYGQGTPTEGCQRFLNEMSKSRQEFAKRRSAYFEAREDPKTNPEDIALQQKEIRELFRAIEGTNTQNCRWAY